MTEPSHKQKRARLSTTGAAILEDYRLRNNGVLDPRDIDILVSQVKELPGDHDFNVTKLKSWFQRRKTTIKWVLLPSCIAHLDTVLKHTPDPTEEEVEAWSAMMCAPLNDVREYVKHVQQQRQTEKMLTPARTSSPEQSVFSPTTPSSTTFADFPIKSDPAYSPSLSANTQLPPDTGTHQQFDIPKTEPVEQLPPLTPKAAREVIISGVLDALTRPLRPPSPPPTTAEEFGAMFAKLRRQGDSINALLKTLQDS